MTWLRKRYCVRARAGEWPASRYKRQRYRDWGERKQRKKEKKAEEKRGGRGVGEMGFSKEKRVGGKEVDS